MKLEEGANNEDLVRKYQLEIELVKLCDDTVYDASGEIVSSASIEVCDSVDNNCNGIIDEITELRDPKLEALNERIGTECGSGSGECRRVGKWECREGARTCSGHEADPRLLYACDGRDDDCDEKVDEFVLTAGDPLSIEVQSTKTVWSAMKSEGYTFVASEAPDANGLPKLEINALKDSLVFPIKNVLDEVGTFAIRGRNPKFFHHFEDTNIDPLTGLLRTDSETLESSEAVIMFYSGLSENNCTNGLDDDEDGKVDCDDNDCKTFGEDQCGESSRCNDDVDNDNDGFIDCEDSECFDDPSCITTSPEVCYDLIDNDGDSFIDCADIGSCCQDPLCSDSPFCKLERCGNGIDDDGDGLTDCADPECCEIEICATSLSCQVETVETCRNDREIDGDGDGLVGCDDPDCCGLRQGCFEKGACAPEKCYNDNTDPESSVDSDGDGKAGCGDPECCSHFHCTEYTICARGEVCDDGLDNDGDGLVDCQDIEECRTHPSCAEICHDNIDNNGDGLVDCKDPHCKLTAECQPKRKEVFACGGSPEDCCCNGIDDNEDGLVDCDNPSCSGVNCVEAPDCTEFSEVCCRKDLGSPNCYLLQGDLPSLPDPDSNLDKDDLDGCADPECDGHTLCDADPSNDETSENCFDGVDNDNNGFTDCEDSACIDINNPALIECLYLLSEAYACDSHNPDDCCFNGEDDSGDSLIDMNDESCKSYFSEHYCPDAATPNLDKCEYVESAVKCDQNTNVDIDHDDHDPCEIAREECVFGSTQDIDEDGSPGCRDPECQGHPGCIPSFTNGEVELCHNGIDDNGDGRVDCEDLKFCAGSIFCSSEVMALKITDNPSFDPSDPNNKRFTITNTCMTCRDKASYNSKGLKIAPFFVDYTTLSEVPSVYVILYGRPIDGDESPTLHSVRLNGNFPTGTESASPVTMDPADIEQRIIKAVSSSFGNALRMVLITEDSEDPTKHNLYLRNASVSQDGRLSINSGQRAFLGRAFLDDTTGKYEFTDPFDLPFDQYEKASDFPIALLTDKTDNRSWIAFPAVSQGEIKLHVTGYEVKNSQPQPDTAKVLTMERRQAGWVLGPMLLSDVKNESLLDVPPEHINTLELVPICSKDELGQDLCGQVMLFLGESHENPSGPANEFHVEIFNTNTADTQEQTQKLAEYPVATIINESKPSDQEYKVPEGFMPLLFAENDFVIAGYEVDGVFYKGEDPPESTQGGTPHVIYQQLPIYNWGVLVEQPGGVVPMLKIVECDGEGSYAPDWISNEEFQSSLDAQSAEEAAAALNNTAGN